MAALALRQQRLQALYRLKLHLRMSAPDLYRSIFIERTAFLYDVLSREEVDSAVLCSGEVPFIRNDLRRLWPICRSLSALQRVMPQSDSITVVDLGCSAGLHSHYVSFLRARAARAFRVLNYIGVDINPIDVRDEKERTLLEISEWFGSDRQLVSWHAAVAALIMRPPNLIKMPIVDVFNLRETLKMAGTVVVLMSSVRHLLSEQDASEVEHFTASLSAEQSVGVITLDSVGYSKFVCVASLGLDSSVVRSEVWSSDDEEIPVLPSVSC
jgi:hypothetical protein